MQPTTFSLAFRITVVAVDARTPGTSGSAAALLEEGGIEDVGSTAIVRRMRESPLRGCWNSVGCTLLSLVQTR